jgi:hypothetical protein
MLSIREGDYGRPDIINALIEKFNYKTYLEVGVDRGITYAAVNCASKESLDPAPIIPVTYVCNSDQGYLLLKYLKKTYDIIFIDAYHQEQQTDRDIHNYFDLLNPKGSLVLHDCGPQNKNEVDEYIFLDNRLYSLGIYSGMCGSTYKAWIKFNRNNPGKGCVVDTDWGCGVITKLEGDDKINIDYTPLSLSWEDFEQNRSKFLNTVDPQVWLENLSL